MKYLAIIYSLLFALLWEMSLSAESLKITTQNWPPYQVLKDGELAGSATKTVKCVLKKLKIKYTIEVLPWKAAQETVKAGKADAFYAAGITKDRDSYAVPTEKIANFKWIWVINKNSDLDPTTAEFKETATVAAKFGTGPEFYLYEHNFKIIASPKELIQLFEMLQAKRFEAFLTPEEPTTELFKSNVVNKDNFKYIFHSNNDLVFYFSKKYVKRYPDIIKKFNRAIKKCEIY